MFVRWQNLLKSWIRPSRPSRRDQSWGRQISAEIWHLETLEERSLPSGWMELDSSASDGGITRGNSASSPDFALDRNGQPTVAWVGTDLLNYPVIYARQWDGSQWAQLAGSASNSGISGNDRLGTSSPAIAIDPSTQRPVVAWQSRDQMGRLNILLKAWDGSSWQALGNSMSTAGLSQITAAAGASNPHIAFGPESAPGLYVGYEISGAQIELRRWNPNSQTWSIVGSRIVGTFSGANEFQLAIRPDGQIVVSYTMKAGNFGQNDVYSLRWNGSQWVPFGGSSNISQTSAVSKLSSLALDNSGNPLIAWIEGNGSSTKLMLKRFDGIRWTELNGSATGSGLGPATTVSLAVDRSTNQPVVSFARPASNPDNNTPLADNVVMRWSGSAWVGFDGSNGAFGITPQLTNVLSTRLALNDRGEPTVVWFDKRNTAVPIAGTVDHSNSAVLLRRYSPGTLSAFDSLDFRDNDYATPANPSLAVNQNFVVEVTNNALGVMDKVTGFNRLQMPLKDLFAPLSEIDASVPDLKCAGAMVSLDAPSGRFLIAAMTKSAQPRLLLALSNTADPTQGFRVTSIAAGSLSAIRGAALRLGGNAEAWFVTINDLPSIFVIPKSSAFQGNWQVRTVTRNSGDRDLVPVSMEGATAGGPMWFISEAGRANGRAVRLIRMTNVLSTSPSFQADDLNVAAYQTTPNAPQASPYYSVATGNSDIVTAAWRNGRLVAAHTVGLSSDSVSHVRWYEFDTTGATPTLRQQGNVAPGSGVFTFSPGISINASGAVGLTYLQMSASEHPSVYISGRAATDSLGTLQPAAKLINGELPAGSTFAEETTARLTAVSYRGSLAVDPNGSRFWQANAYTKALYPAGLSYADWGTWIQAFEITSQTTLPTQANLRVIDAYLTDNAGNRLADIRPGTVVYVQVEFETKDLPAGSSYAIRQSIDGVIKTNTINWSAGRTGTGRYIHRFGAWTLNAGTQTVTVMLDAANSIAETNETDNTRTFNNSVAASSANLRIVDVYLTDRNGTRLTTLTAGVEVYVQIEFETKDIPSGRSYVVSQTIAGVTKTNTVNWASGQMGTGRYVHRWGSWNLDSGTYSVSAALDAANGVAESDETDNGRTATVTVR